ncbi:MAG: DALR anticodon-binding domain-containing protein, partial [Cyclobacteriaceae bacterium]
LSYGMVDLPSGKMKSREGTVVDADDLMAEMIDEAEKQTRELGKIDEMNEKEASSLFEMIGLGALKFYLLKVDPKKRMMFNPNESIQLQGHTAPFIQYTHARIRSIVRKAATMNSNKDLSSIDILLPNEQKLISLLAIYPDRLQDAAKSYSPSIIANYAYDLAKEYNQFYQSIPIFSESDEQKLGLRVTLSEKVGEVINKAMGLLGVNVPERM